MPDSRYNASPAIPNKFLTENGSAVTLQELLGGEPMDSSDVPTRYNISRPIPNKFLNPDGGTATLQELLAAAGGLGNGDGHGAAGTNGWTPIFATVADGDRFVIKIIDYKGGTGVKPVSGQYISTLGLTSDILQATDIRGLRGIKGDRGDVGPPGSFPDAPTDGEIYGRKDGTWSKVVVPGESASVIFLTAAGMSDEVPTTNQTILPSTWFDNNPGQWRDILEIGVLPHLRNGTIEFKAGNRFAVKLWLTAAMARNNAQFRTQAIDRRDGIILASATTMTNLPNNTPAPIPITFENVHAIDRTLELEHLIMRVSINTPEWSSQVGILSRIPDEISYVLHNSSHSITIEGEQGPPGDSIVNIFEDTTEVINCSIEELQTKLSELPRYLTKHYTINVAAGTTDDDILIANFCGNGNLIINGDTVASDSRTVKSIKIQNCSNARVQITGFNATTNHMAFHVYKCMCSLLFLRGLKSESQANDCGIFVQETQHTLIVDCFISNKAHAIRCRLARASVMGLMGSENSVIFAAEAGSIIHKISIGGVSGDTINLVSDGSLIIGQRGAMIGDD